MIRQLPGPLLIAEHHAFVQAICERPADNNPRLAYADWLDKNGDEERAEFIRLQIRYEALKVERCSAIIRYGYHALLPGIVELNELKRRSDELRRAHASRWWSAHPNGTWRPLGIVADSVPTPLLGSVRLEWSRGCVAGLTIGAVDWAVCAAFFAWHPDHSRVTCRTCRGSGLAPPQKYKVVAPGIPRRTNRYDRKAGAKCSTCLGKRTLVAPCPYGALPLESVHIVRFDPRRDATSPSRNVYMLNGTTKNYPIVPDRHAPGVPFAALYEKEWPWITFTVAMG